MKVNIMSKRLVTQIVEERLVPIYRELASLKAYIDELGIKQTDYDSILRRIRESHKK